MSINDLARQFIKIYKDEGLTQEIDGDTCNLGIVPAGEVKQFKFWVFNDSIHFFKDMQFTVDHEDAKVIQSPESLSARAVDELIIEWSPSIDIIESLKAVIKIKTQLITG